MSENRYLIKNTDDIVTPALIYYEDIILSNIREMISVAGGTERLWPHVKTHKTEKLVSIQIKMGITKFKCATIAEAQMVAECGATDALIAYPLIGPNIRRFFELQKSYPNTRFWAIGDDLKQAEYLGNMACAQQEEVCFLVDVNMGTNRTGVEIEKLQEFYENCDKLPGLKVMGMHCYDGNHGIEDYGQRKEAVDTVNHKVIEIVKILEAEGYDCSVMVMGGTPSFPCHALYDKLYLSPGTGVISDFGYSQRFKDEKFIPAGILLTRVVSHAKAGYFTLDLGYKGIASDPVGLRGSIVGIEYAESIGQNEEHWIWKMQDGHEEERPAIGEALYVIPTHICPTSALYPDVLVARNGEIVDKWEVTARNRKLTI